MRTVPQLLLLIAAASTIGCVAESSSEPDIETSGLAISVSLEGATDVDGMSFMVTEAPCSPGDSVDGAVWQGTAELSDMFLSAVPDFDQRPYDGDSEHLFADRYFLLPAGCYNVLVTPIDAQGEPSEMCYSAHQDGVEVIDGQTTEIVLINQCQGPARGGLDIVATINRPPQIDDLTFNPSKFVSSCEPTAVCLTASDPDGDPIEFAWEQLDAKLLTMPPTFSTTVNPNGSVTQCASIVPAEIGTYQFRSLVFDLAYDAAGQQVRIEDLLSAQGDPHQSRDSIDFPLHSGVGDCTL